MTLNEFLVYLEKNLSNYDLFIIKAEEYQEGKNKKRPPAKRWNEKKLNKAIVGMWKQSMEVGYNNIKSQIGKIQFDPYDRWVDFMNKNDILESINDSISELEFE